MASRIRRIRKIRHVAGVSTVTVNCVYLYIDATIKEELPVSGTISRVVTWLLHVAAALAW